MGKLNQINCRKLLTLARSAIRSRLGDDVTWPSGEDEELLRHAGTFVTLKLNGQLRGCIGNIVPAGSLWDSVKRNAVNAAFFDSRFAEVGKSELDKIEISISVLSETQKLDFENSAELCQKLRPHVDGVILKKGRFSSTFLPQVWDQLPQIEQFLSQLCLKAGLTTDCWRDENIEIETYQVQNFSEEVR